MTQLTTEQFKEALPPSLHKSLNPALMDKINNTLANSDVAQALKENIVSYTSVMKDGSFKMESYLNAVNYISYKLMGETNKVAYAKTFPDKWAAWKLAGVDNASLAKYINIYNKSKLVNLIYEQTLVPVYILNADVYQKAINTQAALMADPDVSPKVRSDAANSILNHLKRPEVQKVEMDVAVKDDSMIRELKNITMGLAAQMQNSIKDGVYSPKEIAHQKIITGETYDNE